MNHKYRITDTRLLTLSRCLVCGLNTMQRKDYDGNGNPGPISYFMPNGHHTSTKIEPTCEEMQIKNLLE